MVSWRRWQLLNKWLLINYSQILISFKPLSRHILLSLSHDAQESLSSNSNFIPNNMSAGCQTFFWLVHFYSFLLDFSSVLQFRSKWWSREISKISPSGFLFGDDIGWVWRFYTLIRAISSKPCKLGTCGCTLALCIKHASKDWVKHEPAGGGKTVWTRWERRAANVWLSHCWKDKKKNRHGGGATHSLEHTHGHHHSLIIREGWH